MEIREKNLPIVSLTFQATRRRLIDDVEHWCYPTDGIFCDEKPGPPIRTDDD